MMSVPSRGSFASRWQNWIRAWGRGEPATSHSAARTVEWAALACSRVDWTSQVRGPLPPGFSRFRGRMTAASTRRHALGRMAVSRLKMLHSPCVRSRRVNHHVIEQAPGDGRPSQRPLLRADTFALNTNRWGFKTRSNGQGEHAGLALLDGDGPASQARRLGRPASASVQTRNCTKRRTAQSNHAHNTPGRPGNKDSGENRERRAPQKSFRASWRRGMKNRLPAPRETGEGNGGRRRRKRQFLKCAEEGNKEKTPSGWLSPDARNWLSFFARSQRH